MSPYIQLLRVQQWAKNLFVFVPMFFAGQMFEWAEYPILISGFLAFSFLASAVYIFNDYRDREVDRLHPKKRFRPLAAGTVKPSMAFALMGGLVLASLGLTLWLARPSFAAVLGSYLVLNVAYTFRLKEVPIVDIFIIAIGFLLRILAGGILSDVIISHWLVIMTFLLALFLGIAKRRDDVLLLAKTGKEMRKSIAGYNLEFVNTSMAMMASIVIVAYLQYTTSPEVTHKLGSDKLYLTSIFVVLGMLRYLQLTLVEQKSENPTRVLYQDLFIQLTLLGWLASFYFILYGSK